MLVAALVVSLAFTLYRLGEIERQRYAMLVGLCLGTITAIDPVCVASAQPRENAWWNIYYGLSP
jgi:xanthine/uracil permease